MAQTEEQILITINGWIDSQADRLMAPHALDVSVTSEEREILWRACREGVRQVQVRRMRAAGIRIPQELTGAAHG